MPSSTPSPDMGIDPLAPLAQLVDWLTSTAVHVTLGVFLGLLAAQLMHRRHLHWSWAAGALVCVVLARSALSEGVVWTLVVAALGTTMRARRWHREELQAGADLAEIAASRRTPLDVLRPLVNRAMSSSRVRMAVSHAVRSIPARGTALSDGAQCINPWFDGDRLSVGRDEHGHRVSFPLGGSTGGTHTLVVGAAGSGKTMTQTWIAVRAIERGMGAVVIDPKNDRGMRDEIRLAAQTVGRPFIEWTPNGSTVYNPYAQGSETEIADKVLAAERFTEPHYLRQAQRYIGHEVRALRKAGLEVSLAALVHYLVPARLEMLVRELPAAETLAVHDYLDSLTARQQSDLAGVRDRLAIMAESDIGCWLEPRTPGVECFDLLEAVRKRAVVYFSLEADRRPLLAAMLAAAIVQDLQTMVAALQGRPVPSLVIVDEFSAIAAEQVVRLFGRARSAGVSLVLGTQELSDLRLPGREMLLEQVLGNLSALIVHRQVVPDSAELIANVAGTEGAWSTSRHSDGRHTSTRVRQFLLHPNKVKGLARGWAAVIVLADGQRVRIAQIFSVDRHR
jgi:hypothetical protein